MALLTVTGVHKKGEGDFALQDINFSQQKLQKIAIAGETGSGKSTLLKIIAGLLPPDTGEILFDRETVKEELVPGHPGISYLSQQFELPKFLRVEQVLAYANTLSVTEADTLYEVCQIDHLLKRKTDQLSGGERQRIAMARLLISSPRLLLLDEPFSHLDMVHKNTLKEVIVDIGKKLKITCILVSHDPADTLSWADRILVMKEGKIIQKGSPEKIYRQPVNEYVAGLFGKYSILQPEQARTVSKLSGVRLRKRDLLIRPEGFKLVKKRRKGLKGEVVQVNFLGGYYEIEISLAGYMITVKSETIKVTPGDQVYVLPVPPVE